MFNNWKLLCSGRINEVDSKMAYPLLRWMSGQPQNLPACADIAYLYFKVPTPVVISLLHTNCKGGFFKYPKASKELKDPRGELLKEKTMQLYHWSGAEYDKHKAVIEFIDVNEINKVIGLDKKECKTLGVDYAERKFKFTTDKPKPTGLAGFM
jgi:hypothetical protein